MGRGRRFSTPTHFDFLPLPILIFYPYPNPGDGHFQLANLPEKWYIAVYSVTGQKVYEQEGEGSNYNSLTPLPTGLYTIKIKSKDNGQESIIKYISM
jgi:hypothetical protein